MVRRDAPPATTVVFDIDDTLYLERDYVASGFAHLDAVVREQHGVDGFGALAWRLFEQGRRGDIIDRALAELGVPATPSDVARLVRGYREHRPRISLLPDAARALAELRGPGVSLAVLSDGPLASQAAKVTALGLRRHARRIVLTDRYGPGYGKPHPRGFEEIAARTGARRLAYVADNPVKDFAAPRRLGWLTVRTRRSLGLHADRPHGADVDATIGDLDELRGVLAQW